MELSGYRVIPASDGTEAVALYAQHKDEIDLVLTDLMMPFLDGKGMIRAIRRLNPQIKVVITSGLNFDEKLLKIQISMSRRFSISRLQR